MPVRRRRTGTYLRAGNQRGVTFSLIRRAAPRMTLQSAHGATSCLPCSLWSARRIRRSLRGAWRPRLAIGRRDERTGSDRRFPTGPGDRERTIRRAELEAKKKDTHTHTHNERKRGKRVRGFSQSSPSGGNRLCGLFEADGRELPRVTSAAADEKTPQTHTHTHARTVEAERSRGEKKDARTTTDG